MGIAHSSAFSSSDMGTAPTSIAPTQHQGGLGAPGISLLDPRSPTQPRTPLHMYPSVSMSPEEAQRVVSLSYLMDPRSPTGERTPIGGRMRSASPLARSLSAPPLQGEEGEKFSRPPVMMVLHEEEEAEALMGHGQEEEHENELEHEQSPDDEAKTELKHQQDQMQRLAASILLEMHNGTDSGTGSASSMSAIGAAVSVPSTTTTTTSTATTATTTLKPLVVDLTPRKTANGTVRRALNPICANSSTSNPSTNTNNTKVNSPMLALRRNSSLRGSLHQQQQPYYDLTIA